jgi:S-adenosylmethionine/arginine decarboxylase-like enzyme
MYRAVAELMAPAPVLDDLEAIEQLVKDVVDTFGLTLLRYEAVDFDPIGITGFGIIGESHISVHAWPEDRYAHVELLTCTTLPDARELRARFPVPEDTLVEVRRCEP